MLAFLAPRALPGVDEVREGVYRRVVAVGDAAGIITLQPTPERDALQLCLPASLAGALAGLVERARRLFDLRADPVAIEASLCADPRLADALARTGSSPRLPGAWDRFETAVRVIVGQQVSVAGATTTAGKLVRLFGERLAVPDGEVAGLALPVPGAAGRGRSGRGGSDATPARGGRAGLRPRRGGRIAVPGHLAQPGRSDRGLAALPGIGPWTAHMIALRAFGEPDAFPVGDLGLRHALDGLSEAEISARAEDWRPWRGYATVLLWQTLSASG